MLRASRDIPKGEEILYNYGRLVLEDTIEADNVTLPIEDDSLSLDHDLSLLDGWVGTVQIESKEQLPSSQHHAALVPRKLRRDEWSALKYHVKNAK